MFLFNRYRNSQQQYSSGNKINAINWKTFLRTWPVFGAESTAVTDENENIYFGSHSGNFYSLDKKGEIKWVFTTKKKIYSSPLIINRAVYFAGGDGFLYSLDLSGNLKWCYDLSKGLQKNKWQKIISAIQHLPFTFSSNRRKNITYRCWSSPNANEEKIFITGFGLGLICIDKDGEVVWTHDLGFPRFQLSGVALDDKNNLYVSSRKGVAFCFKENGELIWKRKLKLFWEPWGNPVVCMDKEQVYFFFSWHEKSGFIFACDFQGNTRWKLKTNAIRGSCAIESRGNHIYCCDLKGYLHKIESSGGKIIKSKRITTAVRGLWTTPTLDKNEDILLSVKDAGDKGRVIKLDKELNIIWEYQTNKVLSVPLINHRGDVLFGCWDGYYYSLKTK